MRSRVWISVGVTALCLCCGGANERANNAPAPESDLPAVANANTERVDGVSEQQNKPPPPAGNFAARTNRTRRDVRITGTPPPLTFQPADEDSKFATAMGPTGEIYEVRVFNSHPRLAKVESTWIDAKSRDITITLKDGQVRSIKTDALPSLKQATTRQLIDIAGL